LVLNETQVNNLNDRLDTVQLLIGDKLADIPYGENGITEIKEEIITEEELTKEPSEAYNNAVRTYHDLAGDNRESGRFR